ncbi:MAG: hypothetical protein Q8L29_00850 [archaeon]|nr:hypothetical protein [archaeon]
MIFNKKGQLGKVITSFPVMLAIFLLIAIFLAIVGMGAIKKPEAFSSFTGVQDSILLEKVIVNGEEMTILDGFVKSHGTMSVYSPWWFLGGKIISNDFGTSLTEAMISKLKEESLISGPNCLLLDLSGSFFVDEKVSGISGLYVKFYNGNVENIGFNVLKASKVYALYGAAVVFLKQSSEGSARETRFVLSPDFSTGDNIKNDEEYIRYYYGNCEVIKDE